jgi:hypothetical protein
MRDASPVESGVLGVGTCGNAFAALPGGLPRLYGAAYVTLKNRGRCLQPTAPVRRGPRGVGERRARRLLCPAVWIVEDNLCVDNLRILDAASRLLRVPRHRITMRLPPPRPSFLHRESSRFWRGRSGVHGALLNYLRRCARLGLWGLRPSTVAPRRQPLNVM